MAVDAALVGRGATTGSSAVTSAGAVATGDALALWVSFDPGTTISSVALTTGEAMTLRDTLTTSGNAKLALYTRDNVTGHAAMVATVNFSGTAFAVAHLIKITGAATACYDAGSLAKVVDTLDPGTVTSGTLAQAASVVLCIYDWNGEGGSNPYTSTNMSIISSEPDAGTYWSSCVGKLVVSSTAAVTPSFSKTSNTSPGDRGLIVAAFRENTGGGAAATDYVENAARPRPGRGPFSVGRFFISTPDAMTSVTASTRTVSASGGLTFGGAAAKTAARAKAAAGGIQFGGTAARSVARAKTASGGLTFAGAAAFAKGVTRVPSGGLTLGGTAAQIRVHVPSPSGGINFGGAAGYSSSGTQR